MFEKLDMKTINFTDENIKKIAEIFPNVVSEDENGKVIDYEALKQELSGNIVEGYKERYSLNWPGKREAQLKANTPTKQTLRPCIEESVNFDTTENLYIEGDNLEVLKILQEGYLNKIKMIYIDPPYNTGKDFVYKDNFTRNSEEELLESGQIDEEGRKLVANLETNGKYHSDWLSMIYPRLKLARNLLKEDGVIFISIDDNEVHNLRKVCDEVFGEENFVNQISVKAKDSSGASGGGEDRKLKKNIEYLIVYSKSDYFKRFNSIYQEQLLSNYIQERKNQSKVFAYTKVLYKEGTEKFHSIIKDGSNNDIKIYIVEDYEIKSVSEISKLENISQDEVYFKYYEKIFTTENAQTSIRDRVKEATPEYNGLVNIYYYPISGKNKGDFTKVSFDGNTKRLVSYLSGVSIKTENEIIKRDKIGTLWSDLSWSNVSNEGEIPYPSGKKPIKLIDRMLKLLLNENDDSKNELILDFFAGSSSTAQAVINYNLDNNTNHKFCMVQVREHINSKDKEQKKLYDFCKANQIKPIITEIGKERIRRAGKKIVEDSGKTNLDIGFRVLKLDSSNMKDVYFNPNEISQQNLFDTVDNIKEDRNDLDLLFGVLIDWGVDLTLPIIKETIQEKDCYFVDSDSLCAYFGNDINEDFIKELAKKEVLRFVFKDSSFGNNDDLKDNVSQIFKQLNPQAEIKVI